MKSILISIAVVCGLTASYLLGRWSAPPPEEMVSVIVAKKDLPVGTVVDDVDNDVTVAKFPKESLPPNFVNSIEEIKGKTLNRTVRKGIFFSDGDLSIPMEIKLPEGTYKYSIRMPDMVSGLCSPGEYVDVCLRELLPDGKNRSELIVRKVMVISHDTRRQRGEPKMPVYVTFIAVTTQQTLVLAAAEKRGELRLMLHDPENTE